MKELWDRILSSPSLFLLILGVICLAISAAGGIQFGTFIMDIAGPNGQLALGIGGGILIAAGLVVLWLTLEKDQSFGYNYGWGIKPELIQCTGHLRDLYHICKNNINKMTRDSTWKYELFNVSIKQYPKNVRMDFKVKVTYPSRGGTDIFHCKGFGPFDGKVAYLKYGFYPDEKKFTGPQWTGVLVLRIPKNGDLNGVWLSASANKDCFFPIGSITFKRSPG